MDGVRPRDYQQPYTPELRDYMDKNEPGWATQGRYPSPQPSPQPGLQLTPQPGPQLAPQPAPQ